MNNGPKLMARISKDYQRCRATRRIHPPPSRPGTRSSNASTVSLEESSLTVSLRGLRPGRRPDTDLDQGLQPPQAARRALEEDPTGSARGGERAAAAGHIPKSGRR